MIAGLDWRSIASARHRFAVSRRSAASATAARRA
jgi:hypothetical protein